MYVHPAVDCRLRAGNGQRWTSGHIRTAICTPIPERAGTISKVRFQYYDKGELNTMTVITQEAAFEAMKEVIDPEIGVNIVDLGLVYGVEVADTNDVEVTMTLTSMGCPLGPVIIRDVQNAVAGVDESVGEVNVRIVWSPPWSVEMMSEDAKDELGIW
jgi:metal-sulfur cluster biosynthetic enzyme